MSASSESSSIDLGALEPNELVRRALAGCADSSTELASRFRPRLLNLIRVRTRGDSDAEDIVQEALAKAFQELARFDPRYRFSTWLYTIAIRLACDHARHQRRRPPCVSLDEAHSVASESADFAQAERQQVVDNVWLTARRVLSESQYSAMWLRYAEEMSVAEVARVLQKTQIGVRVLLHRSRSILISELAHHDSSGQQGFGTTGKDD